MHAIEKRIQHVIVSYAAYITAGLAFVVFADVFYYAAPSDWRFVLVFVPYGLLVREVRYRSTKAFAVALVLLFCMFVSFLLEGAGVHTERIAVWVVLFTGFGVIQQWTE